MSGISGIYNLDGRPADAQLLAQMARAIAHRGPDGIGQWVGGPIGLAHLLLQTVPESEGEKQPFVSDDGLRSLTMDGRIDNRKELRASFESKGFRLRGQTDAELVLRAYECWGEECPIRLLGDFAFAIWDERKMQLFCARDYVGVRPFYYYRTASLFAFGSEIRALLALESIPRHLNDSRIVDFLVEALEREDQESTFYRDVLRLPAGHCLTVAPGHFAIRDYWKLKAPPPLKLKSLEAYGEAFREVFVEAVRCRLRSSHRVGATLSGGIDSSSVVCTARDLLSDELKEKLHTFSLVVPDESQTGEACIKEVLRGGRILSNIVRSSDATNLEDEMRVADEPFELTNALSNWFVFSAAQNAGVRVLLDGVSGDDISVPYNYLSILIRSLHWKTVASELIYNAAVYQEPIWSNLLLHGFGPLLPNLSVRSRVRLRKYRKMSLLKASLISDEFADRMKASERFETMSRRMWQISQDVGSLHAWIFTSGIVSFFFEQSGRIAAMKGIEPRHPFSDRRIIEFFLSLPLKMKTHSPLPKRVIREGMKGILPERVRRQLPFDHPGQAFLSASVAQSAQLLSLARFKQLLAPLAGYVNVNQLEADRASLLDGKTEGSFPIWRVMSLSIWLHTRHMRPSFSGAAENGTTRA